MKSKPLDLDKIINSFEADIQSILYVMNKGLPNEEKENKEQLMKLLKNLLYQYKQRIKSKCEFYLRYKDNPELLIKEHLEYKKDVKRFYDSGRKTRHREIVGMWSLDEYNLWLFKLAFKIGDKK